MECTYLKDIDGVPYCKIAEELSGIPCSINEEVCIACSKAEPPKSHNKVTASIAVIRLQRVDPKKAKEVLDQNRHVFEIKTHQVGLGEGPGTELKKILSWFAIDSPGCQCLNRAKTMNTWGPQGCRNNIPTILDWLREEAQKRNLPFIEVVAKQLVLLAISRAEKCLQKDVSSST